MPQLDLLPITDYLRIGNGELHITACKGCPFNCEFCNEVYVSTGKLRYRNTQQIVEYLTEIAASYGATSAYLDSSTFTYNKEWVIKLCSELISSGKPILPWKTCTRLDCIDEELITLMGKAGCTRISVGVESISPDIQKRIKKKTDAMINCIKYVDGSDDQKISCVADLVTCAQDACAHAHRMAKLEAGGLQKHI